MELTAQNVEKVFLGCLYEKTPEDISKAVLVEGITVKVGFDPKMVEKNKANIESLLGQLPDSFKEGMSFLNGCLRKDGVQWGEHRGVEQLFMLGMAIKKVVCPMPKDLWSVLPGGVPYYQVVES